jgi:predicted transcriptional regulator
MTKFALIFLSLVLINSAYSIPYYYGQVLLKDEPYSGVAVTATYVTNENRVRSESRLTMSRSEANMRGDRSLEGYYYFEKGILQAKDGTNIVFSVNGLPYSFVVPANSYVEFYKVPTISFSYASQSIGESYNSTYSNYTSPDTEYVEEVFNESLLYVKDSFSVPNTSIEAAIPNISTSEAIETAAEGPRPIETIIIDAGENKYLKILSSLAAIVFVIAGIIGIALVLKYGGGLISANMSEMIETPLNRKAKKALTVKAGSLKTDTFGIDIQKKGLDALTLFVQMNGNVLHIFKSNRYYGHIKEKAMLNLHQDQTIADEEITKENLLMQSGINLEHAYYLMQGKKCDNMIVEENGKATGEISLSDIQMALKGIQVFKLKSTPTVRDIMKKSATIGKSETVEKALKQFDAGDRLIVVLDEKKPIGAITFKDCVRGYLRYGQEIVNKPVNSIMSVTLTSIDPDLDIFKANAFALEKEFKNYPVIIKGEVVGILTQSRLIEEIITELRDISER